MTCRSDDILDVVYQKSLGIEALINMKLESRGFFVLVRSRDTWVLHHNSLKDGLVEVLEIKLRPGNGVIFIVMEEEHLVDHCLSSDEISGFLVEVPEKSNALIQTDQY